MSNAKSNINVKIDTEIKEQAARLLGRMGIDSTDSLFLTPNFYTAIYIISSRGISLIIFTQSSSSIFEKDKLYTGILFDFFHYFFFRDCFSVFYLT